MCLIQEAVQEHRKTDIIILNDISLGPEKRKINILRKLMEWVFCGEKHNHNCKDRYFTEMNHSYCVF